ncbi:hypothetical protein IW261DRAFT_1635377 [Armillaria novae-zelandiae]|uniref:Glycoside hydrolase family 76 protein n=1 Tax=Armillaria novae-zelandiae TaxID=153914 RepID=A0AA39P3M2_9AGAR|nr:hypothetical protein IW261DRAFT_1635377 [Armillaria novae-zelandiae]
MRPFILAWMLLVPLLRSGGAQDLPTPTSWKNPNITSSRDDRISIASAAIDEAVSMLQPDGQFKDSTFDIPGRLYAQMAEFDRLTNQTTYKQTLKQYFVLAESISPEFSTTYNYGYAAARAYAAYRDPDFIALAVTSWTTARQCTISKEQAVSGIIHCKKSKIAPSCQGTLLTGGTYFSTDPTDAYLFSMASGFFLAVSALLAEATSNQTYLDAAIESVEFIQSHLLNPSNTVMAFLSSNISQHCTTDITASLDNTGTFVEGLATLADITRNTSTEALLHSIMTTAITNPSWQELDGIVRGTTDGGHYILRALGAFYERNTTSSSLREYIKEYIGIQYNAVVQKATLDGSNIYGLPWTGPPRTVFSSSNQTLALSALLSGIQLLDNQSSSKISDGPTSLNGITTSSRPPARATTSSPLTQKHNPMGAIVGGVLGGLAVLGVATACVLLYHRQHRQRNHAPPVNESSSQILTPFMATRIQADISREPDFNQGKIARYPAFASRGESSTPPGADADARRADGQVLTVLNAALSPQNPIDNQRREELPTDELLRMLIQRRLLRNRWDGEHEGPPPEYREGSTM